MNGIDHIQQAFQQARQAGRAALMPYYTLGYPTPAASMQAVLALARSGADLIELGVPFSDPLADGPTIQRSSQMALQQGMTVDGCLSILRSLRQRGINQPLLLMGYINPILSYGAAQFITRAAEAGADGLIVPDLPVQEASAVEEQCHNAGLALVYLVAPTSTPQRIRLLARHSSGFLYLVSVNGVTGARSSIARELPRFIARVRQHAALPLAVGFGISTPIQAAQVSRLADGVIIGSALIDAVSQSTEVPQTAGHFIKEMLQEMSSAGKKKSATRPPRLP